MPIEHVPDWTDWLATPLSGLAAVEAALRCHVCKDLYKTPMITSCSHTFCSICIRRALSNDGKCPLCRAPEQELKLRSNWSMEEAVEAFAKARTDALAFAMDATSASPSGKRKADARDPPEVSPKRLRTSARLSKTRAEAAIASSAVQEHQEAVETPQDGESTPDDPDGPVSCPLCQRKMKAWQVFPHLEACPGPSNQPESERSDSPVALSSQARPRQDRSHERLPALNYSMLKDQALRKKMGELGLSAQGSRLLLERRHKEWLTLWNANCDAARPKKRVELLHDLDVWERTQGGRAPTAGKSFQSAATIKDKDFDGAAWAVKHESSFKDLIASAKETRKNAITGAGEADQATDLERQNGASAVLADSNSPSPLSPSKSDPDACDGQTMQPPPGPSATPGPLAAAIPPAYPDDLGLEAQDIGG